MNPLDFNKVPEIEAKRWSYVEHYREIISGEWKRIYTVAKELKLFFGKRNNHYILFRFLEGSLTGYTLDKKCEDYFLVIPDEELPLYINDTSLYPNHVEVISKRFKGDLCRPAERQDLVDAYYSCQKMLEDINNKKRIEQDNMIRALMSYFTAEKRSLLDNYTQKIMSLNVNGRIYIYKYYNNDLIAPEDISFFFNFENQKK